MVRGSRSVWATTGYPSVQCPGEAIHLWDWRFSHQTQLLSSTFKILFEMVLWAHLASVTPVKRSDWPLETWKPPSVRRASASSHWPPHALLFCTSPSRFPQAPKLIVILMLKSFLTTLAHPHCFFKPRLDKPWLIGQILPWLVFIQPIRGKRGFSIFK